MKVLGTPVFLISLIILSEVQFLVFALKEEPRNAVKKKTSHIVSPEEVLVE